MNNVAPFKGDEPARPWTTISIASAALLIQLLPSLQSLLQLDYSALRTGQIWRLFTGHLTHWSASHFVWDTLTFLVVGFIAERHDRRALISSILISSIAISLGMPALYPHLTSYRGLSGIDTALVTLVIVQLAQYRSPPMRWLALIAFLAMTLKLGAEWIGGRSLFVDNAAGGFAPVPAAHLIGAIAGLTVGVAGPIIRRFRPRWTLPCFPQFGA